MKKTIVRGIVRRLLAGSLLAVAVAGCKPDPDLKDPVPPPTPYALTVSPTLETSPRIPEDNPLTNEGVALGRFLFYEKQLSSDQSMSCGTCHQQAKAFTDGLPVARGVGGAQGTRNTMSLTNVMWNRFLNWDGRFTRIEDQNRLPIENHIEMNMPLAQAVSRLQQSTFYPAQFERAFGTTTITPELLLKALGQFQRTLISGNSRYDEYRRTGRGFTQEEVLGLKLFTTHPIPAVPGDSALELRGGNCGDCHSGSGLLMANMFANNGLDANPADPGLGGITGAAIDRGRFAAPTMRNIALTAPYMHDGRLNTLEEVLDHYNEHVEFESPNLDANMHTQNYGPTPGLHLTPIEKRAIVAFLRTLSDSTFTHDPRFSDPNR